MTFVLLFVDQNKQPRFIQGTVDQINAELRELWQDNEIDRDDWGFYGNWKLLGIESDQIAEIESIECVLTPQFVVN